MYTIRNMGNLEMPLFLLFSKGFPPFFFSNLNLQEAISHATVISTFEYSNGNSLQFKCK